MHKSIPFLFLTSVSLSMVQAIMNFPRQVNTCSDGVQFYRCATGPFVGCCAMDPCTDGICRDDQSSQTSTTVISIQSTSTPTAALTIPIPSITSTVPNPPSTSPTSSSATTTVSAISTNSTTSSVHITTTQFESFVVTLTPTNQSTFVTSTTITASNTAVTLAAATSNRGSRTSVVAIAGGAIGSFAAVGIFCTLLYLCCRRRRKPSEDSSLRHEEQRKTSLVRSDDHNKALTATVVHKDEFGARDPFAERGGMFKLFGCPHNKSPPSDMDLIC